jgi:hypothetical protein
MNTPVRYPETRALRGIFDAIGPRYQRSIPGGPKRLRPSAGWQVAREMARPDTQLTAPSICAPASLLGEWRQWPRQQQAARRAKNRQHDEVGLPPNVRSWHKAAGHLALDNVCNWGNSGRS